MKRGFVYLDEVVKPVRWDAKYCGADNFTGAPVDGYQVNRVVGTMELAAALQRAAALAAERDLGLFLWDAYRPMRAVRRFMEWASEPEDGRTKEKHYPRINKGDMIPQGYVAEKSGHSRGSSVDLTLYTLNSGELLDMGGDFDLMDEISRHGAAGITEAAKGNRVLLRQLMEQSGFRAFSGEWWHYTLREEPYPDAYFDFVIE